MADQPNNSAQTPAAAPKLPGVTPLDGTTTLDDKMAFEPERLAYRSAVVVAERIATNVRELKPPPTNVVITGGELLGDLSNLVATKVILEQIVTEFDAIPRLAERLAPAKRSRALESVATGAVAPAAAAAPLAAAVLAGVNPVIAGVQAGLGLLALLRQNVQFTGATTTIDQVAVQFAVASALVSQTIRVEIEPIATLPALEAKDSDLRQHLEQVERARAAAWNAVAPHVKGLLDAQLRLEAASSMPDNTAAVQDAAQQLTELRQQMAPVTDALEHADARLTSVNAALEKVDESSGMMALGKLLRAERLQVEKPHYLHVRVVSSGGHHRVTRSLLRTIFSGDGVSAMGGVVIRWALVDAEGAFLMGGILDERFAADFPIAT
jgi:hypothetical protein